MQVALAHKLGGAWFFSVSTAPMQQASAERGGQSHILHTITLQSAASLVG